MTQYKLGLVLSGGGTKGIAHAGVLKFLEEQKIFPEVFACCSAGSIVGALYAIGKTPQEILEFFKSVDFFNWRHFAINQSGIISSKIFKNYFTPIFEDLKISDLKKEVKIVATELISGNQKIFDKTDKVVDAIIASCSIPGITTPYVVGKEIFSDGGILNNFPADIIHNDCEKLIGVFVSPLQDVKMENLQSIKSVVSRSYDLLSYRTELHKFSYCDWFISSKKLAHYGTFERKANRLEEIFEIGYQAAKDSYKNAKL
jgi:NTE family protein